jgi:hypothetical protein
VGRVCCAPARTQTRLRANKHKDIFRRRNFIFHLKRG